MVLGGVTLGMLSSYTVLCGKLLFSCVMMQGSLYAHVLYCVCSPDAHANNARDGGRLPETQDEATELHATIISENSTQVDFPVQKIVLDSLLISS